MNDIEIKKAISLLKADKDFIKNNLRATRHVFNEFDLAIQALEKQIPKKPTEHYNWCDLTTDDFRWYCKNCDNNLDETEKHCPNCGQKLDWLEVENE